ncbi:YceI family protein [Pedobacter sp. Du54]|uniref:YceI family protein n=1 Tax=Pedobacter anseongensis TaxID=3133439 RepID=UPI0030B4CA0B
MNRLVLILSVAWLAISSTTKMEINTATSWVLWKGTKMRGSGSHEGTLNFKSGHLLLKDGKISGGVIEIDMNSLEVTDIPVHETVPRNALTTHLKEEFETNRYPLAKFSVTGSTDKKIRGNMTIMDRTLPISIPYKKTADGFVADLALSREAWGIGKKANWLEKRLVDDTIQVRIFLKSKN